MPSGRPRRNVKLIKRDGSTVPAYPVPPWWTLLTYTLSHTDNVITVTIDTDISNVMTLAYTERKPTLLSRNYKAPIFPRTHHQDFDIQDVTFVPQNEGTEVTRHTFTLYPRNGCHNVYLVFFDGTDPFQRRSISPIFAFTYCAEGTGIPTAQNVLYPAFPPPYDPPYFVIARTAAVNPPTLIPLDLSGGEIVWLGDQWFATVHVHQPSLPTCPIIDTYNGAWREYVIRVDRSDVTFNQSLFGLAVAGVQLNPPAGIVEEPFFGFFECIPPGTDALASLDVNPALGEWVGLLESGTGPSPDVTVSPPFGFDFPWFQPGPFDGITVTAHSSNSDIANTMLAVTFQSVSGITYIEDITSRWKAFPAVPPAR